MERPKLGLELPLDVPRTATTTFQLASHTFEVEVTGRSEAGLLAAVFAIQLARYNGQASIPITLSRVGGGGEVQLTRPLVIATPDGVTAGDVLRQVLEQSAGPTKLGPRIEGGHAAITQIAGLAPADLAALAARASLPSREADLHLVWTAHARPLDGSIEIRAAFLYNASLIEDTSVRRFAGHLRALVESFDPAAPIAKLAMLAPEERAWLDEVSAGPTRELAMTPLHRRVEEHARRTPAAIAVRHRDQSLDYAELDRRANRLAHHLVERGARAETRVIVCVEPGFDIAVALLAILKAGAVYVPLDPTYPAARIAVILEDTRPLVVITRSNLIEKLGFEGHATLALDRATLDGVRDVPPTIGVSMSDTAYIYYTSGTTGKPKGVMASHANLVTYIQVAQDRYAITSREVMPAIARFSFSISMFELMSPLVAGGTLVVLDREHVLDPARLVRTLAEMTFFHAGPSLMKSVFAHVQKAGLDVAMFDRVRHASSGGDLIAPEVLRALVATFRRAEIFVIYGCSEIACMGCTYPVPRDQPIERTFVGKPFDNVVARVLDRAGNPCPVGVPGEIWFAGGGVAKGYLDRPELTAEKFVPYGGRRFYRTGDLGRLSEDGWIEVLGRNDFQIKVRGMRIELAEVEHNLRRAPGVKDGVVVARATPGGEKALVAYVVLEQPDAESRRAVMTGVRRHMIEQVPDYMVPATFVELPALPLNHNLKVDRNALPEPPKVEARAPDPTHDPESQAELQLAGAWRRILGVERVRLDDNFFELGGDSLKAMELISLCELELGVQIDGLEVLRESLEVLAAICDRRVGRTPPSRTREPAAHTLEAFFIGDLYSVLHDVPAGTRATETAALIVAPPGQDRLRAHFVLSQLSRQLASRGVPAMQFDLYGCWDSLGESVDATVARWRRDVANAARELARRTGARRIVGVGLRLGALLLCASEVELDALVLWDPVVEGERWYDEAAAMHRTYLRGMQHLRLGRAPRRIPDGEELLGTTYANATLRELRDLSLAPPAKIPVAWLATTAHEAQRAAFDKLGRDGRLEVLASVDCGWSDATRLDDMLPDVGISRVLAAMVVP